MQVDNLAQSGRTPKQIRTSLIVQAHNAPDKALAKLTLPSDSQIAARKSNQVVQNVPWLNVCHRVAWSEAVLHMFMPSCGLCPADEEVFLESADQC